MHFTDGSSSVCLPLLRLYWVSQPIKAITFVFFFSLSTINSIVFICTEKYQWCPQRHLRISSLVRWFLLKNHVCLSQHHFPPPVLSFFFFFFIRRYNDFNIPLTVSLLVCWAGSRRFHQRCCAWHSSSKVCPGNRQLYTHLHLLGMPTGWTSPSFYPHCYFWLAYNASITSLSLNRKATTSFVSKATMKSAGGRSKLVWH